jgi:hypothetical protein
MKSHVLLTVSSQTYERREGRGGQGVAGDTKQFFDTAVAGNI